MELRRLLTAMALAFALPSAAHAQSGGDAAPPHETPAYRELADRATQAVVERRLDDALMLFREMHVAAPSARTLWALGRVHYERGEYVRALTRLDEALDDGRRPLSLEQRAEAEALRDNARSVTSELTVVVEPPDATLLVDDREIEGRTVRLDPGEHLVRAIAPDHREARRRITVAAGEDTSLRLRLEAETPIPLPAVMQGRTTARVQLRGTTPGLTLHGATIHPNTPDWTPPALCELPCELELPMGAYQVGVARPGFPKPALSRQLLMINGDLEGQISYVDNEGARIEYGVGMGVTAGLGLAGLVGGILLIDEGSADGQIGGSMLTGVGIALTLVGGLGLLVLGDWPDEARVEVFTGLPPGTPSFPSMATGRP